MSLAARPLSLLLLLALLASSAGRAAAQGAARVHCDVEDADLGDVLRQVARRAGASLVVDPRVHETVTISLRDIPWRECVDVLARMTRCEVVERPSGVLFVTQPATLSATFEQVEVATVLRWLATQGGESVWVDPAVSAPVSLTLTDVTWPEAVKLVADAARLQVAWVDGCALVSAAAPDAGLTQRPSLAARFPDSKRVSLAPEPSTLADVLRDLATAADVRVIFDEDGFDDLTVNAVLHDVPWAEAMDWMLELADCTARELPGGALHVMGRSRVMIADTTGPVRSSLVDVAYKGGASLVLSPGVAGNVATSSHGLPTDLALALIARSAGLHLWSDGEVFVVSHLPLGDPPVATLPDPSAPTVTAQAVAAPVRAWFELLASVGSLRVELAPEVGPVVTSVLFGVAPRRALELTAWANGHEVAERDGALHVTGDGWIVVEDVPAPAPAPVAEASEVDPALRGEVTAKADILIKEVVSLAEERQVEELIVKFTELRQLMTDHGPLGAEAVRAAMIKWRQRLQDLGEVHLSILLQLQIAEGNQLLRAMADAIRADRFADTADLFEQLEEKAEEMRAEEREVFHRNAEALYLRGRALADRSARLARAAQLELRLTATAPEVGAIVNGRLVRDGDPVLSADGNELPGLRLVEIQAWVVRLRLDDTEFVRELRR